MATWYISTTGNDQTGNGSTSLPWATISGTHGKAGVLTGDTIICKNGTYVWSTQDFTKSLTVQAETNGAVTFNGAGANAEWRGNNNSGITMVITGIRFTNVVSSSSVSPFRLDNNQAGVTYTWTFTNCQFDTITLNHSSDQTNGIFGKQSTNATIIVLTVNSCLFYGLSKNSVAARAYFVGLRGATTGSIITFNSCTFYLSASGTSSPTRFGSFFGSTGVVFNFKNNIFHNGTGGTYTWWDTAPATINSTYSDFFQVTSYPSGTNVIVSDPLFLDASNNDFRLRPASPAIDTGTLV